ncbi:MAG: M12 family metallo-peptidase [Candidatus Thorarchaeota archaeon]
MKSELKSCLAMLVLIVFVLNFNLTSISSIYVTEIDDTNGLQLNEKYNPYNEQDLNLYSTLEESSTSDIEQTITSARTGTQKFAVICVKFKDIPDTRWEVAGIGGLMSYTNLFWQNASYNQIDISWQIEGWYTLSKDKADYGKLTDAFGEIILEAVQLADNDIDFVQFNHILVWINSRFSGISSLGPSTVFPWISNSKAFSITMVGENDPDTVPQVWGRVAHEMGHAFGLGHTHGDGESAETKYYASINSLMAGGYPSALNVYSQLFDSKSGWFDTENNELTVTTGTAMNYTLYPRYLDTIGILQALKVKVSDDYYYRIEVVRKHDEDKWNPYEGVLIYEVDKGAPNSDECTDMDSTPGSTNPDYYDCLWQVGDKFEDTDHNIVIEIKEEIGQNYKIFVQNIGTTKVDLSIADWGSPPGNTPPYESEDIWIDSPVNGFGKLRYHDENNNPIGNGDEPLVNHENRLYAMVHNIGSADAVNFDVAFFTNYPMSGGDDEVWTLIGTKTVELLPHGESLAIFVPWTPEMNILAGNDFTFKYHSCIKVYIFEDEFEVTEGNNEAQENINYFEVIGEGSANLPGKSISNFFQPITTTVKVKNPYSTTKEIYIGMNDLNENWNVSGEGLYQWHTFTAGQTKSFEITIAPGDVIRFTEKIMPSLYIGVIQSEDEDIEGFYPGSHMISLPSLTIGAIAMYRSELELDGAVRSGNIDLFGDVLYIDTVPVDDQPLAADRNIMIEITNTDTDTTEFYVAPYNADGSFEYQYSVTTPGNYSVTAYFAGTGVIAKSYSVTLLIDTISGEVSTSKPGVFIPGFEVITLLVSIFSIVIKRKNQRK